MSEANARIIIDRLLRESDWVLSGDDGVVNVDTEMQNQAGSPHNQTVNNGKIILESK